MIDLNGNWDFRDDSGDYSCAITFPGDGISALHHAGLIPDPYWGRNEYDLRWISERDWVARRSFDLDSDAHDLVLDGLDCVVEVSVNGTQVLAADNAFRVWRVDLRGVARRGANEIEIRFRSNVKEAARRQENQPYFVPYTKNYEIPHGNMLRKVQCDFGWDWNIALAPFGVLGGVWIEPKRKARLSHVTIDQTHADGAATVTVTAKIEGDGEGQPVLFRFGGRENEANVVGRVARAVFVVQDPEMWWPAGQGMQPLYDLTVRFGDQVEERQIGLRTFELITEKDDAGTGFKFRVNGRDVFAKGANWIPADALPSRITPDVVRDLLQSAVDANMNMIRIWGGGRYEPGWFYDLCDGLGLMIWQDFMFSCNLYPADTAFLDDVAAEVRENVERLHHHACIAVWCGDNELIGALTWYPESLANRDRYLVAYDRLNRVIETALKDVAPGAVWWPSSPSPGLLDFGDAWHDDSKGDMHFWSVWHENREFAHYRDVKPRFCSEFGFQSYPSNSVVETFTAPADRNIAAPVFESHQKNKGGNERIAATMFREFRFPVDFENFVYVSQVQQGMAIKTAVDYWRSLKPHCMGALFWQLNDTWPVCSWSSLDYGGGWKLLHHMARRFFAPVAVVAVPTREGIVLTGINDHADPIALTVTARAVGMNGETRELHQSTATVGSSSVALLTLPNEVLGSGELLAFNWETPDGQRGGDVFAPRPYKTYDLQAPELDLSVQGDELTISAQRLALFVAIEADVPGRFSNNAFTVFPGFPAKVTFTPAEPGANPNYTLRDLHSATYAA